MNTSNGVSMSIDPLHILFVLPRLPAPPHDGGAVYVYHMLRELSEMGHRLTILSFISNKHDQDPVASAEFGKLYAKDGQFKPYSVEAVLKSTLTRQPIVIQHRMNRSLMQEMIQKMKLDLQTTPQKASDSGKKEPDVILIEGLHPAHFMDLLRESFPGKKIVLRTSNVEYQLLERNASMTRNPLLRWFYKDQARLLKRFELQKLKEADFVTAISTPDAACFERELPGLNSFISTAGALLSPSVSYSSRESLHLLAISNWRWQPNIDGLKWFMEQCWPTIRREEPGCKLTIAGDWLAREYQEAWGKDPQIEITGLVKDLTPLRSKASLFIAPLFSGSGMKLKVLEALAAGLPLVTTARGIDGIDAVNGRDYLLANVPDDFTNAVLKVMRDPELAANLSDSGRALIEREYTWKKKAEELIGYLHETVLGE